MILVAGVGYSHLSDLSFGPKLVERLQRMDWPDEVRIEDFSYGPIAILEWFEESPGRKFERAIFAGAEERGREPGTLVSYGWLPSPRPPEEIQARVAEALTGVISLENLLVIAHHFGVLPARTSIIELEPAALEWGLDLSLIGLQRMEQATEWVRRECRSGTMTNGHNEEIAIRG